MSEDTKTQFRTEGQPAFPAENKENDNSAASSTGETNTEQTQSQAGDQNSGDTNTADGDKGFADHPRWKERENDWTKKFNDQEQRHVGEMTKFREEMELKFAGISGGNKGNDAAADAPVDVPSWFGGDEKQWKEFTGWNQSLISKAKEEARSETLKEIETKSSAEQKAIEGATTYFNEQVVAIESDKTINPQGIKVDRNKLLKTALDNDLVDSQGRWNYKAAFRLMTSPNASSAQNTQDRKNLANATVSEGRTEDKTRTYTTSEDFQKPGGRPW